MATKKRSTQLSHADVESIEEEVMSEYGHEHPLYKFDGNEADRRMTYLALTDPAGATAAQAEYAFQLISEGMEWNVALKKAGVPAVSILRASAAGFMHSAGYSTPRRPPRRNPSCPVCGYHENPDDGDDDMFDNPRGKLPSATVSMAAKRLVAQIPESVRGPARKKAFADWAKIVAADEAMPEKVRALARDKARMDDLLNVVYALSYGDWHVG